MLQYRSICTVYDIALPVYTTQLSVHKLELWIGSGVEHAVGAWLCLSLPRIFEMVFNLVLVGCS